MEENVGSYMKREMVTVRSDDSIVELERALAHHRISGVPVVDDGALVGVVSRGDLVRQLAVEEALAEIATDYYRDPGLPMGEDAELGAISGEQLHSKKVADLMTTRLITVESSAPMADASRLMLEHGIHRVPVVDDGRLVGILSSHDVLRMVAQTAIATD
ncbi:MAG: CBS domain-containing protein [Myxococcales bacterium]|nr:CBS domain-containing protein [Myxococcales bacterium]